MSIFELLHTSLQNRTLLPQKDFVAQETYTTFDVSTAIDEVMATSDTRTDIHADLGSGSSYGSVQVFDPSNNVVVEVNFNGSGLAK